MAKPIFSDDELLAWLERQWCEKQRFLCEEQLAYYMQFRLWKAAEDTAYVVMLNRCRYFMGSVQLTEGMLHKVNLLSETMREKLQEASYFYVGHTHGTKQTTPSPEDIHTTRILAARYPDKPKFIGHIIVNHHLDYTYIKP